MDDGVLQKTQVDGLNVCVVDVHQVWSTLCIGRTVPLGRLEWLWSTRGSAMRNDSSTSTKATFRATSSDNMLELLDPSVPHDWYQNAYLHILIVKVEELDPGRESQCFFRVRNFVDNCRQSRLEYLIVLVADDQAVLSNKRTVDKLRAEVNVTSRNRERLVTIPQAAKDNEQTPISHLHHSPAHQDFLVRLRECARDGVEARVQAYETEVSRRLEDRSSASWSFTSFFALKEGLNFVFMQIGRRDIALRGYDELDNTLNERNDARSLRFCDSDTMSLASSIIDPSAKDYRSLVVNGTITELDMRVYLFARQAVLLLADRKFSDAAERGLKFITVAARRISEVSSSGATSSSMIHSFRDVWIFKSARCLSSALACAIPAAATSSNPSQKPLGTARERHTARLLASFQVHALKAFAGLASVVFPGFSVSASEIAHESSAVTVDDKDFLATISDDVLTEALRSRSQAVALYSELANAAASLYELGGRARGAAALDGDVGAMRLRMDFPSEAEELLSAQCSRFSDDRGWDALHYRRRVQLATAEKLLDRVQEYLVSCLTLLCMGRNVKRMQGFSEVHSTADVFPEINADYWASEVVLTAGKLPRVMKYKADKLFAVSVCTNAEWWKEGCPGDALVLLDSDLPASLQVDTVHVEMRWGGPHAQSENPQVVGNQVSTSACAIPGRSDNSGSLPVSSSLSSDVAGLSGDNFVLTKYGPVMLNAGINEIKVSAADIPRSGRFFVSQVSLVLGKLKLVQVNPKPSVCPTVTVRGKSAGKSGAGAGASAASPIHGDWLSLSKPRFPCFFVSPRPPAASVYVEQREDLFFIPDVVQFVKVKVVAGSSGILAGSTLNLTLSSSTDQRSCITSISALNTNSECYAELVDMLEAPSGDDTVSSHLQVLRIKVKDRHRISGTATLPEMCPFESSEFRLAIRVTRASSSLVYRRATRSNSSHHVALSFQYQCAEKTSSSSRVYSSEGVCTLKIDCLLCVTAFLDLDSTEDDIGDAQSTMNGGHLGVYPYNCGIVVCTLQSCVQKGGHLTIRNLSIDLPPWLVHKPQVSLNLESLLPCRMQCGSVFSCPFEVDVCVQQVDDVSGTERSLKFQNRERGPPRADLHIDEHDELNSKTRSSTRHELSSSGDDEDSNGVSHPDFVDAGHVAIVDDPANQTNSAGLRSPEQVYTEVLENSNGTLDQIDVDELDESRINSVYSRSESFRSARVDIGCSDRSVTDFSRPDDNDATDNYWKGFTELRRQFPDADCSMAILRAECEVENVATSATLEFPIPIELFGLRCRRYRVEQPSMVDIAVGETCHYKVLVSGAGHDVSKEGGDTEVLYYEFEFDPSFWVVSGKTRGRLLMKAGTSELIQVRVVALRAGLTYQPTIILFSASNVRLAPTRVDKVNAASQIHVVPIRSVRSLCSTVPLPAVRPGTELVQTQSHDEKGEERGFSGSVEVVAADNFFV